MKLTNPTGRKTECRWLEMSCGVEVLFSYETPIAFSGPTGRFRRTNDWGPTTGKHFKEGGASWYEVIEDFEEKLDIAIRQAYMEPVRRRVLGVAA